MVAIEKVNTAYIKWSIYQIDAIDIKNHFC